MCSKAWGISPFLKRARLSSPRLLHEGSLLVNCLLASTESPSLHSQCLGTEFITTSPSFSLRGGLSFSLIAIHRCSVCEGGD